MKENEIQDNSRSLYELMTAIATDGTTILGYIPLCEKLWQSEQSHIWLAAALTRKAGVLTPDPDQACLGFLAEKAIEELRHGLETQFSKDIFIEYLPAVIQLLPDAVWQQPLKIWSELLMALRDEFGLKTAVKSSSLSTTAVQKQEELARFLIDAVGVKWNEDLDRKLEHWRDKPEYAWLSAFRDSARLDIIIDKAKKRQLARYSLNDPSLFNTFCKIRAFEQRRFLLVRDKQTEATVWPEIKLEEEQKTIIWQFDLLLKRESHFGVYLDGSPVAEMEFVKKSSGGFMITKATGILMLLKVKFQQELTVKKAAADRPCGLVKLMAMLHGSIKLVGDNNAILILRWCDEVDRV